MTIDNPGAVLLNAEQVARLQELLEAVFEIPNAISGDLETGSHHFNNAASEAFAKKHPGLMAALMLVAVHAQRLGESLEKP